MVPHCLEDGGDLGGCRAEGPSAAGDGGPAAASLTLDDGGTHVHIFESLLLEGLFVGDLLYSQVLCIS